MTEPESIFMLLLVDTYPAALINSSPADRFPYRRFFFVANLTISVQESDGSFFESYTALCWKQENRRLQVMREDDQPLVAQPSEGDGRIDSSQFISSKEMEQLYVEVLYTIRHKLGAHSAKYPHHFKEDLVHYAQTAFGVGQEYHRRCNAIASEEKPPIVVLNVTVIEAEGLEAKDPNGFSDPYCMLGIQPGCCSGNRGSAEQPSPQQLTQPPLDTIGSNEELPTTSSVSLSTGDQRRDSLVSMIPIEKMKKHSSFRLSFKRKDPSVVTSTVVVSAGGNSNQIGPANRPSLGPASSNTISVVGSSVGNNSNSSSNSCILHGREQRDSLHAALPAKFIRATSVKGATLNPKWNEKFRFDIDDVCSDTLHLDIWDHDDEYSVLDAVSKLNEVRGVKGLGRFFKQIAQSARSGTQDDFLGCVNIPLQVIKIDSTLSSDKFCKFYDRLHSALQMLLNFLHAEGKGLSLEALKCPTYQRVEEKISLHKAKTEQLIDLYHIGRLGQQQQLHGSGTIDAPYGVLNIRVYFHHDSLSVEILSARDVIPLDPNGLSDPFVIVELLPRRLFPNCGEQQTTVKRRTLHPVFDECFEFPVTLEQCRQETAMLLFTVMDYDVLTANDFAGEALLSLNTVPGVAATPQGLDTFHGLKQIDLVLMHQPNKRRSSDPVGVGVACLGPNSARVCQKAKRTSRQLKHDRWRRKLGWTPPSNPTKTKTSALN
ncbi:putative BAI1-associated protein 3 [Daphnia magna]|uniref:Putative BAI1-associated protein 3 n=1 Tax=Daphnia magna TaxID=35525 RepID=A0A164SSS8_9CRUS|nr:putative BAI1-associated protein 3 [Daphnia magna]